MSDEERKRKEWIKEALKEWLDAEKKATYETIGKWATGTLAAILVAALVYFTLMAYGWKHS
jgi:hypothetical protein